ncbi:tRNA dihydrouridine synthase [Paludibacter jiangxiensis]|uniref:tRNA-dihydrouridine synthase n=1 Tax=Paludibacter jiangxiensis TaxID=681398 RepID=A0A171AVL8_9BACT|nr:tRNA-dihydrouridine synthase family protein [Paludibacter jiangxiensis]GAT64339.1 tRNA-dihydrouridine synthase [Paludibacter jiangxiensis]
MKIYLAPLQGLTDWMFRESFSKHVGLFDKTFTPFVRVQNGEFYRPNQCNDLLPEHNRFQKPVPQFLGNDAASFFRFEELCRSHGYTEININMGCPYPMVTGRRMGAGLLPYPEEIKNLLEVICHDSTMKISVKCRLGLEHISEFEALIPVFNAFPLEEIIIHPRVGKQQYKGDVDFDAFLNYASALKAPVCYNGDINSNEDATRILQQAPEVKALMLGRGVLQHPFLLSELRNASLTADEKAARLKSFHKELITHCQQKYSGDHHFLKHLEEFWSYQSAEFENSHKLFKLIKKCKSLDQYERVIFSAINGILGA